jgi:N-acetylmuramic acid 6-phosphate etherase
VTTDTASRTGTTDPDQLDVTTAPTEQRLAATTRIDEVATAELLSLINNEDAKVAGAVRSTFDVLAVVVEAAEAAVRAGHAIHYFGAGTSGRFGVLDAAEVPPTYGVADTLVVAHLAGGPGAMTTAVEDAEDDLEAGRTEAMDSVRPGDVVFGLAASGRTPYVLGALSAARAIGATTVAVTSNPVAPIADQADHHLCLPTGAEAVTGSTRMKAGTAQKVLLHTFSTALMVKLGRTYSNLMVDVVATNDKLRNRVVNILRQASGATVGQAVAALETAGGDAKTATVMLLTGTDAKAARALLERANGVPRRAAAIGGAARHVARVAPSAPRIVVGVDVGASGYRLAVEGAPREVGERRRELRPQVRSGGVSLDDILSVLADDLREVAETGAIGCVGIGIAGGAQFAGNAMQIAATLADLAQAECVVTMPDSVAAYVGAIGLSPGTVLAAGTGSVAVASDLKAEWRRLDGLGHLLGDHGSGARLGQRALELALAAQTGRVNASPALTAAAHRRFGGVPDLVRTIYTTHERAAVLASFVPDVLEAAAAGDQVAFRLAGETADAIAATLSAASDGIAGERAVTGGLVTPGGLIRELLEVRLAAAGIALAQARATPAVGAAIVAQAFDDGTLPSIVGAQLTGLFRR